ncbi:hypothetical protein KBC03_02930 [Patescibacteria group bacterium]|nr:hypothetical protein [Patescibacteria group bacterium]
MEQNTIIRKIFCVFLKMGTYKNVIIETTTADPQELKLQVPKAGRPGSDIPVHAFYTMEKLFYLTSDNIQLESKEVNQSKTYFLNAKPVTLRQMEKEAHEEGAAEPWTTNDARELLEKMQKDESLKGIQCKLTEYFFVFDETKHVLL